jgi:hypothetical protein
LTYEQYYEHGDFVFHKVSSALEWNGTTILDVTDPEQPRIVKYLPGHEGAESRAVQVVERYFDGRDYLLRNQESSQFIGFEVFDITERSSPRLVSKIEGLKLSHKGGGMRKPARPIFQEYGRTGKDST